MAGRGRGMDDGRDRDVVENILSHTETKIILDNGSHFPYNQEDLKKSKCQYAFLVSWKDCEGDFTWQTFERLDGDLAENYGRKEGIELFGRQRGLRDSPEPRRSVDEIEEAQKQRHITAVEVAQKQRLQSSIAASIADSNKPSSSHSLAKKKNKNDDPKTREIDGKKKKKKTEAAKHEVIELESENEEEVKKRVRANVKKMMNLDIGMDQGSRSTSDHVLEKAHVKGLRIHYSREDNRGEKRMHELHKSKNLMEAAQYGVEKEFSQHMNIRRQREEEAKKKEKKEEEKKIKKMENENRRRRAIASSDESDEDDDSKEEKKKKKKHSNDVEYISDQNKKESPELKKKEERREREQKESNKTDHGETSMKRSIKNKRDRVVPIYEQSDDGLEYSPIKKRKDSKEEDMIKKEDGKRSNRGSKDEEKRTSKNRSPKEGKKKQVKREDEHGCWSDASSDESGGEWEVDEVKMHVKVQEVLDGRDIEGRDELNWKMIHKTQIPIIFRVIFKSMKQGWKYKKHEWLTMEEMDNLPKLNRYADMSKLVLPKGYESLMKKKVAKDYDDIFKA